MDFVRHINTTARPFQQGAVPPQAHAPNAALLIDFDNVTMGIRSDLTRELRNLLDSEVIRGKVAVQRAYADWRRYPQYIVPLSEASIDLIFAPAYGSSKKNATDIRLAIDALELVFTRPEIGTFMLLSGDSDFSSLVLKLKEYGKYVIGVGIRESASDLLVQNCDEYYSYSALTGLTAAGEDSGERHDPWELVERAVLRMEKNGDVMRSDRLKQVMLEMDPGFDEKELGFTKYNKFLAEAASKNRLALNKLENGQFEVTPAGKSSSGGSEREDGKGRGGRGRGRDRGRRGRRDDDARTASASGRDGGGASGPSADAAPAPRQDEQSPRAEDRSPPEESEPARAPSARSKGGSGDVEGGEAYAYGLLARAVADIGGASRDPVRDSELKRRMLEIDGNFDEATLGFSKFSRFLRRAHDEEVIDLHRTPEGHYEAVLGGKASAYRGQDGSGGAGAPAEKRGGDEGGEDKPSRGRGRGRGGRSGRSAEAVADRAERADHEAGHEGENGAGAARERAAQAEHAAAAAAAEASSGDDEGTGGREATPAATAPEPEPEPQAAKPLERPRSWGRSRRGGAPSGPPPVLPGQTVGTSAPKAEPGRDGAGSGAGDQGDRAGLPRERSEVIGYLVARYKGVGERTASTVVDAFGPTEVFRVLGEDPERVRDLVGPARAQMLIDGWAADPARS
jgi:uncharacterized protein (TIGR00288 family)